MASPADKALADVAHALNAVKSVGQARAAAGAALVRISTGYKIAAGFSKFKTGIDPLGRRRVYDKIRADIETLYRALPVTGTMPIAADTWGKLRPLINRAYVEVYGDEETAGNPPDLDVVGILVSSIAAAPGLLLKTVGTAVAAVGKEAGGVVGGTLGGLFSGLGVSGIAVVVVVLIAVVWARRKGLV